MKNLHIKPNITMRRTLLSDKTRFKKFFFVKYIKAQYTEYID